MCCRGRTFALEVRRQVLKPPDRIRGYSRDRDQPKSLGERHDRTALKPDSEGLFLTDDRAKDVRHDKAVGRAKAALPLGVLRRFSSPLQAVLLALLHPRIAREQSGLAERQSIRGFVDL